jgi:hypothetical protein
MIISASLEGTFDLGLDLDLGLDEIEADAEGAEEDDDDENEDDEVFIRSVAQLMRLSPLPSIDLRISTSLATAKTTKAGLLELLLNIT